MLLTLRDEKNNLVVKDMLDINFDMKVESVKDKYCVRINRRYKLAGEYFSREEAEEQMLILANARNNIEQELRDF